MVTHLMAKLNTHTHTQCGNRLKCMVQTTSGKQRCHYLHSKASFRQTDIKEEQKRPQKTFIDAVKDDMQMVGVTEEQVERGSDMSIYQLWE